MTDGLQQLQYGASVAVQAGYSKNLEEVFGSGKNSAATDRYYHVLILLDPILDTQQQKMESWTIRSAANDMGQQEPSKQFLLCHRSGRYVNHVQSYADN